MEDSDTPIRVVPLTPDRWDDLVELFGPSGADGGCWCMFWRLTQKDYARNSPRGNQEMLNALVASGNPTGLLAYDGSRVVGWCGVSPRSSFGRLEHSKFFPATTDRLTWSIVCFFIHRKWRKQAVARCLLEAALRYAGEHGAQVVEAYPVDPEGGKIPPKEGYPGLLGMFLAAGFRQVAVTQARSGGHFRSIVQYELPEDYR